MMIAQGPIHLPESLSPATRDKLLRCHWRPTLRDRAAIVAAFEAEGLPVYEPVIDYQVTYGGLVLRDDDELCLSLFRTCECADDGRCSDFSHAQGKHLMRHFRIDGRDFFECADDNFATPAYYLIDEQGAIYDHVPSYPREDHRHLIPGAPSPEAWIENNGF